jgi:hypothetical protein
MAKIEPRIEPIGETIPEMENKFAVASRLASLISRNEIVIGRDMPDNLGGDHAELLPSPPGYDAGRIALERLVNI